MNVPSSDTITVEVDNVVTTGYTQSGSTITFTTAPSSLATIFIKGNPQDYLLLDRTGW